MSDKFKKGDRVRLNSSYLYHRDMKDKVATVVRNAIFYRHGGAAIAIKFDGDTKTSFYHSNYLEHARDAHS